MSGAAPVGKTWHVRIDLEEYEGRTTAVARLDTGAGTDLSGSGEAVLNPRDPDVPEIGDELAAARALSHLAHVLLDTAEVDLSQVLHSPVRFVE